MRAHLQFVKKLHHNLTVKKKKKIQSNNNTEVLSKTAMSISENVLQLLFPEA